MIDLNFDPFPELATGRLVLRQLTPGDCRELLTLRSDVDVNRFIDRPKTTSINEAGQFIDKINHGITNNEWVYWALTLKEDPKLIGTICYWNIIEEKLSAEIGYELHPAFQGKGMMQEAFHTVINYGFENMHLGMITAFTNFENRNSIRLLEKNNFSRNKKLEQEMKHELKSYIIYSLTKTNK